MPMPMYKVTSFDCETYLIRAGLLAPRLVCGSFAERRGGTRWDQGEIKAGLYDREDTLDFITELLRDEYQIIVTHNGVYDFAVVAAERPELLELIFAAYERGGIRCTRVRQKLIDIANGEHKFHTERYESGGQQLVRRTKTAYHLDKLVWRHFNVVLPKVGTWRLRFAELDGVPIDKYPPEASEYCLKDAQYPLRIFEKQQYELCDDQADYDTLSPITSLPDETPQMAANWALHLMSVWGVRTDAEMVYRVKDRLTREYAEANAKLREHKLVRADGSKDMTAIREYIVRAYERQGTLAPTTPTGEVGTDRVVVAQAAQEQKHEEGAPHPEWCALASDHKGSCRDILHFKVVAGQREKQLSNWISILETGVQHPYNPPFNSLVETGRTSCGADSTENDGEGNIQNFPRKGDVRPCIVPRKGTKFADADYDTIELRALAQACLTLIGHSSMAEALRRDIDLHSAFAADLMGVEYEEFMERLKAGDPVCDEQRQFAKIANFGFPGGMVGRTLVEYALGYGGIKITREFGEFLHSAWHKKWPEMKPYFRYISSITGDSEGQVQQLFSGRIRGGVSYTQAANTFFQGLAADGAKRALYVVSRECYLGKMEDGQPSPLHGCRPVLFLHDEIMMEVPIDWANLERSTAATKRLQTVMIAEMQKYMPDIPVKASPCMMSRWYKGAKAVYDKRGNILPAKAIEVLDEKSGKKFTKWVADVPEGVNIAC